MTLAFDLLTGSGIDIDEPKPLWQPIPNSPQERAYNSEADIIGFGGAAGGAKTWLILGYAFTKHKRVRIFRPTFVELQGLIDDGNTILSGRASFVSGKGWRFDDKKVMLGYVQHPKDWEKWKGDRVDLMAFDEADKFSKSIVDQLSGWNGTMDANQKVRKLLCFNPPNAQGEWLVEYFGAWILDTHDNPAEDGELRYYAKYKDKEIEVLTDDVVTMTGKDLKAYYLEEHSEKRFYIDKRLYNVAEHDGVLLQVLSRTFFRSLVDNNPYAMEGGYDKQLEDMPEPYRSQLRYGDFSIGKADDEFQTIPTEWITAAQDRWTATEEPDVLLRAVGVDPSRGGADKFVISTLRANYFDELRVYAGETIPKDKGGQYGAMLVLSAINGNMPIIAVDADGIGASVYDALLENDELSIMAINSGSKGYGKDKSGKFGFTNLRSKMWWMFREALDPEAGLNIALPPSRTLRNELRAPTYSTITGRIQVERKDNIRKRIGRSTDHADAIIYAWHCSTNYRQRAKVRMM